MHMTVAWFAVADMESTRKFYAETLGLPVSFEMPGWVEFGGGPGRRRRALQDAARSTLPGARPVLEVKDLDATVASLRERGVKFLGEPETIPGVVKLISMEDSTGNVLQLAQVLLEAAN